MTDTAHGPQDGEPTGGTAYPSDQYSNMPPPQGQPFYGPTGGTGGPNSALPGATTNGLAVASLVLGLVGLCGIGSILAIVFSVRSKNQIRRSGGRQSGTGLATAGLVLGIVQLALVPILLAVAIPTFLGARTTVEERSGQQLVRNGLTNAYTIFANTQDFSAITLGDFESADPAIHWVAPGTVPAVGQLTFALGGSGPSSSIELTSPSSDGKCWMIWSGTSQQTFYGEDTSGCQSDDTPANASTYPPTSAGSIHWATNGFPSQ